MTQLLDRRSTGGRPPVLDEEKRRKILAALAAGSTCRAAAASVGCDHATVARTMLRDPGFAGAVKRPSLPHLIPSF